VRGGNSADLGAATRPQPGRWGDGDGNVAIYDAVNSIEPNASSVPSLLHAIAHHVARGGGSTGGISRALFRTFLQERVGLERALRNSLAECPGRPGQIGRNPAREKNVAGQIIAWAQQ